MGSTLAAARRVKKWISQVGILLNVYSVMTSQQLHPPLQQVSYKGHSCELTVDYDEGFTLKDGQNGSLVFNKTFPGANKYKSREIMLEVRPLNVCSELVNSSDDGARLLWLEFRQVKHN